VVANFAAGIAQKKLTAKEVVETMQATAGKLQSILRGLFSLDLSSSSCTCKQTLKEARM